MDGPDAAIDLRWRPALAPHARLRTDPVTGEPILLYPEGFLILNDTAHEIVLRCDGTLSVAELVQRLAEEFDASEAVLRRDVLENLDRLRRQNLLRFSK